MMHRPGWVESFKPLPVQERQGPRYALETRPVVVIDRKEVRASTAFDCDRMADCRHSDRVLVVIDNGLNQSVSVLVTGNISEVPTGATEVNSTPLVIDSQSRSAIMLKNEEWWPFMGVNITPAAAPTAGQLGVTIYLQEPVNG